VFVWIFHRVSGAVLIVLLAFQLTTGFFQASYANSDMVKTMADLHKHRVLNCVMVFLVVFHALYGLRTMLLDLGVKAEKPLFWACTILGSVLFAVFLVLFVTMVRP
jgi:succinate dehydrogenase cytochrome b556 subunit